MANWLQNNAVTIAILITLISLAFSARRYVGIRQRELKQQNFINYHNLIDKLVGAREGHSPKLDSQIAVIYELQNYPEYYEVSIRILEGLQQCWKNEVGSERLLEEISLTLSKLKCYESRMLTSLIKKLS